MVPLLVSIVALLDTDRSPEVIGLHNLYGNQRQATDEHDAHGGNNDRTDPQENLFSFPRAVYTGAVGRSDSKAVSQADGLSAG
jgi:hypothetical protein